MVSSVFMGCFTLPFCSGADSWGEVHWNKMRIWGMEFLLYWKYFTRRKYMKGCGKACKKRGYMRVERKGVINEGGLVKMEEMVDLWEGEGYS